MKNLQKYLLLIILFLISLPIIDIKYCNYITPSTNTFGRSPIIEKSKIESGYMLFTPFSTADNLQTNSNVYLTDLFGKTVHKWQTKYQALYSILDKNANLYVELITPGKNGEFPSGGRTGIIQKLDWNGNIIWEYQNKNLHHDFDILPNENIAAIIWEPLREDLTKKIKGGVPGTEFKNQMWSDGIIEVDKEKNIIWSWHLAEHINQEKEYLGAYSPRSELGHSNSLRYIEKNPFDGTEAYLLSVRMLNSIFLIRKSDGKVIWRSPENMLSLQHDATLTTNGNILVFDNGLDRNPSPRPIQGSRVLEINPLSNKIVWEFNSGKSGGERSKFKSDIISGAQRLSNGNTLVTNGPQGVMFEVTKDKKLVWEIINTHSFESSGPWPNNIIFKARRYKNDEIRWPEKLPKPLPKTSLICSQIHDLF